MRLAASEKDSRERPVSDICDFGHSETSGAVTSLPHVQVTCRVSPLRRFPPACALALDHDDVRQISFNWKTGICELCPYDVRGLKLCDMV